MVCRQRHFCSQEAYQTFCQKRGSGLPLVSSSRGRLPRATSTRGTLFRSRARAPLVVLACAQCSLFYSSRRFSLASLIGAWSLDRSDILAQITFQVERSAGGEPSVIDPVRPQRNSYSLSDLSEYAARLSASVSSAGFGSSPKRRTRATSTRRSLFRSRESSAGGSHLRAMHSFLMISRQALQPG